MEGEKKKKQDIKHTQKGEDDYLHHRILQPSLRQEYGGVRSDHG